ncbi:MAG: hypothetical protein FWD40_04670 [Treponema sp.]|nr:hypothetical protein [Treponema sp.]
MDKEKDETKNVASLIIDLIRYFATIFTLSILAISFAGFLLYYYAPDVQDVSALFATGGANLPYIVILQIAGFSLILAFFLILFISQRFIIKMRFWLRILLIFISTLITFSVFAVIFKWFPVNDPQAWIGFIVSTFICYTISLGLTFLKFKIERKKYNKLLAKYKEAQNKP